jgi:signal transduction histidine kinase/CheY-like chemotaxis protein
MAAGLPERGIRVAAADTTPDVRPLDAVRAEQVRLLYAGSAVSLATTLLVNLLVAGLLVATGGLPWTIAGAWALAVAAETAGGLYLRGAYFRADPGVTEWRAWGRRGVVRVAVGGIVRAVILPWLLIPGRFDPQMLATLLMVSGTYGIIGSAGAYRPALYAYVVSFTVMVAWIALQGELLHQVTAAIIVLWLPSVAMLGRRYSAMLEEALFLRFENAALAEDLRAQTRAAEQNSRAKSRFLAAASHDLRQPVHALGMFVGALRGHRLSARSRTLVDHIDASVAALDGLFASLLDISKLDAGVVEGRPQPIAIQALLERLCRELSGEAAGKGIELAQQPTSLAVLSDPALLERILRNLIGNAVRYTERGRVVVGARRVGADGVRLEVWDSGPGVAIAEREAIFEEFYQVANPDRDRTKGLGLGLPIVRRLAAILGHTLSFDSRVGRGSVFRLTVVRTAPPAASVSAPTAPSGERSKGVILVIDDEAAIRVGMSEILATWGRRAIAAGGADEALELLRAQGLRPELIISDYRLRGEDGIAVIRRLQGVYGEVPAMLLTGDTAPERIREAQASGYPLLHKPVAHGRLRAAVTSLLRRRPVTAL